MSCRKSQTKYSERNRAPSKHLWRKAQRSAAKCSDPIQSGAARALSLGNVPSQRSSTSSLGFECELPMLTAGPKYSVGASRGTMSPRPREKVVPSSPHAPKAARREVALGACSAMQGNGFSRRSSGSIYGWQILSPVTVLKTLRQVVKPINAKGKPHTRQNYLSNQHVGASPCFVPEMFRPRLTVRGAASAMARDRYREARKADDPARRR